MNILNKPTLKKEQLLEWIKTKNPNQLAIELLNDYWNISIENEVDPVIVYCQSMHETGYLKFGGVLTAEYKNTCGLKNSKGGGCNDPDAHAKFNTWRDGITAQVQHLALYAGSKNYPLKNPIDPRHFPYLLGKCKTLEELDGNWAGAGYSSKILKLIKEVEAIKITDNKDEIISELNKKIEFLENKLDKIRALL